MKTIPLLIPILLIGICIFWFTTSVAPVLAVEAKYQTKKIMQEVFHTTSPLGIILPNLQTTFDIKGRQSTHQQAGLYIPKVYLDEPIVFNVNPNDPQEYQPVIKHAIAHAAGTGLPGDNNLGYYFAHSSTNAFTRQFKASFYLLGKLEPGDEIYLWHNQNRTVYTVTQKVVTESTDVGFLTQTYPNETIVLQTCWPPGTTSKRLLVFATKS